MNDAATYARGPVVFKDDMLMTARGVHLFRLVEPGCVLDVEKASYEAIDARRVRVSGSRYEATPYTMKLEGAGGGPFQTFMLVGIEDPLVLEDIDGFLARMHADLVGKVKRTLGAGAEPFDISLRPYGWNAVSGLKPPPGTPVPREIGLMFIATARSQIGRAHV